MFLLRKIGELVRGTATPFQVLLASVLGGLLGFAPSFLHGPGLVVVVGLVLLVLNANLLAAAIVAGAGKLAALALLPVTFELGRFLLDGPTRELFASAVNAPVLAWFGLEYYAGAGGLVLGLVFGIVAGAILLVPLRIFRRAVARTEDATSFYQRRQANPFVRVAFWLLFGPRKNWEQYRRLLERPIGNPVRVSGLVVAALVVGALVFAQSRFAAPLLAAGLKSGLEHATGATADVGAVELDLKENRLAVDDLALADPHALESDLFRAQKLECSVAGVEILRKRLKLDRVVASGASTGLKRTTPGVRTTKPEPEPEPAPPPPAKPGEEWKSLDEYLETARVWKARLEQAQKWIDKIHRQRKEGAPDSGGAKGAPESGETWQQKLEREAREKGYANVAATHLVRGAPLLEIGELVAEKIKSDALGGRTFDLKIEHLSTNPSLVDAPIHVTFKTGDGLLALESALGAEARTPTQSFVDFHVAGLPTSAIGDQLAAKRSGVLPISGGTLDGAFKLAWSANESPYFDTPLAVKLHDTTISLSKSSSAKVKELVVPLALKGPLASPSVRLDADEFAQYLARAGAEALGQQVKDEAKQRLESAVDKLKQGGSLKDAAKEAQKGLSDLNPFAKKKKPKDGAKKDDGKQ